MRLLDDKVALITGGGTGIGEGVAHLFATEGARVFVLDSNAATADSTAGASRAAGGVAMAFASDVRRPDTLAPAMEKAMAEYGRIDILVNNAGIYPRRRFLDMTEAEWDQMQDVNVKGIYHCTKLVLPHMVARRSGQIVNISSVTFFLGTPDLTHYVASKGAVIGFTRSLAREVGEHNVRVNCITPGAILVEAERAVATDEQIAKIVDQQCLKRRLLPVDVARVCLFLASELSGGLTGQIVNVDGGLLMH